MPARPSLIQRSRSSSRLAISLIIKTLGSVLESNHDKVSVAYGNPGGWEGWLQVEAHCAFVAQKLTVLREDSPYGDKRRADFVLLMDNQEPIVFELKCESHWQGKAILKAIEKDVEKIKLFKELGYVVVVAKSLGDDVSDLLGAKPVAKIEEFFLFVVNGADLK